MTEKTKVGGVAALWRYPVASLGGDSVAQLALDRRGVVGDRAWGVVALDDGATGVASGGRRWRRMVQVRARFLGEPDGGVLPPVEIAFPSGERVIAGEPAADAAMSAFLGFPVAVRPTEGSSAEGDGPRCPRAYESAPLHLVTTASLARLGALHPEGRIDARRFRPNLVLETDAQEGFVEGAWVGRRLHVGEAVLAIDDHCARCSMTTLAQGELDDDRTILRTILAHNGGNLGVYARVETPAALAVGTPAGLI